MIRINVTVDAEISPDSAVEELKNNIQHLKEALKAKLENASSSEMPELRLAAAAPAEKNSDNFQVIGVFLREISSYLRVHPWPQRVTIVCKDEKAATLYRQIYNFYIAETKEDRLKDQSWD